MSNTMTLGWIGLGKMGSPMSRHLASAGHTMHVYDSAPAAQAALEDAGAHVEANARDVAAAARDEQVPVFLISLIRQQYEAARAPGVGRKTSSFCWSNMRRWREWKSAQEPDRTLAPST
jgi:3-hydroxyisobutyrate dehydrogenase-like beta-hydroxyacid dehydrogenase